jgi:curved DNA-binding protein CbpA
MRDRRDDYYEVLGVARDASMNDIRRAYRRLARLHHPDAVPQPGGGQRFVLVAQAYEVLRDPGKRARYDRQLPPSGRPGYDDRRPPDRPGAAERRWEASLRRPRSATLELSPREADLVAVAPLRLIDGHGLAIEVPAGTRHGDTLRVASGAGRWGNLVITVSMPSPARSRLDG